MRTLSALSPEQLRRAEALLALPPPGSRIEAAKIYGIDLTLLVEQLRLTPAQRAAKLETATLELDQVRGVARRRT
jgi:hypothetical protein